MRDNYKKVTTKTNDAQYLVSTLDIKWLVSPKNAWVTVNTGESIADA